MNTSLSLALSTLSAVRPSTPAAPATTPAVPALVIPQGLSTVEARVYAFAASQSAATAQERWAWRVRHAQIALERKGWAVDTQTFLHGTLPWTEKDSVPGDIRAAEAQSAQLYAQYAQEMRAQRLEALAERVANALERVANVVAPVEAPKPPAPQLDATTTARFEAIEKAQAEQQKILAAIAAKVGVTTP